MSDEIFQHRACSIQSDSKTFPNQSYFESNPALMNKYWEDDIIRDKNGLVGRILRVGWSDEEEGQQNPVCRNIALYH